MSVSIVEILSGDKGLDLQNGYWARQPTILGNWDTIRIGARIHVSQASADGLVSSPRFRFGMCSGMTNVPGKVIDGDVGNSLAWFSPGTSWNYSTNGWVAPASASGANQIQKLETGTEGVAALSSSTFFGAISSADVVNRMPFIVTITKGSPNYTFAFARRTGATAGPGFDRTLETMYAAMESSSPATVLGSNHGETSNTIAMDEATHGTLDTVFVTWAQSSPPIYVSEILVALLA